MILGCGVAAERSSGVGGGERIDDEDDPSFDQFARSPVGYGLFLYYL